MRRSNYKILSATFLAMALGCGAMANSSGSAVVPAPVAAKSALPAAAEPDRSSVDAPAGLVAMGRVLAPAKLVDKIFEWADLPLNWRSLLASEGEGLAQVVNLDAPIEFAAMIGPDDEQGETALLAVISAGLVSLEQAAEALRAAGVELSEQQPGVYRVGRGNKSSCAIAVALGSSPARVVCGDEPALDQLLPFATRGLPSVAISDADVSLRILAKPARERFAPQLERMRAAVVPWLLREYSLDAPHFDRALVDSLQGGADELFSAMGHAETLTFEGTIDDARQTLTLEAAFVLRSSDSVLSTTLMELAARASAPPPAFWELPGDVDSVVWSDLSGTRGMATVHERAAALLQGLLEHEGVEPRAIQGVPLALDLVLGPRSPVLGVQGNAPSVPAGSKASPKWFAYALPRSLKEVERGLDAAVAIGTSPALDRGHADWVFKARKRRRAVAGVRGEAIEYQLKLPRAIANHVPQLERDGASVDHAMDWVLIAHQRGELTWFVGAEDRARADWALSHVVDGSRAPLGRERALETLRASRGFCAGAVTWRGMLDSLVEARVLPAASIKAGAEGDTVWMPYTCSVTRAESQMRLAMAVELKRALFSAASRAAMASLGQLLGR